MIKRGPLAEIKLTVATRYPVLLQSIEVRPCRHLPFPCRSYLSASRCG